MAYYELADFIPSVPDELIETNVEKIYQKPNAFSLDRSWDWWYFTTLADKTIHDFLQPYFDFSISVYYQLSGAQLTPHVDNGRTFCYNYTILPGGPDVRTRWYSSSGVITYEVTAPIKTWHRLQVDVTHDISPIESHRLSLTIQKANI